MINTTKIQIAVISIILTIGTLCSIVPAQASPTMSKAKVQPTTVNVTGTINKLAVEGICYQLAADNGKKYELMGKFPKIDGTKVQVSGVVKTDMVTICQVGQPLQVKTVKVIK
jgi:hypothetical protein